MSGAIGEYIQAIRSYFLSRAFVDESDSDLQDDDVPAIRIPLPEGTKNYVTPQGAQKLLSELQELTANVRPSLAVRVSTQNREGVSLNSDEIISARKQLRMTDRRIDWWEPRLT